MTDQSKNRPIAELRGLAGCKATFWRNPTDKGGVRYSVQLARTYFKDGQYHDTSYFGPSELLQIAHLAARAYDKLIEVRADDREADAGDQE